MDATVLCISFHTMNSVLSSPRHFESNCEHVTCFKLYVTWRGDLLLPWDLIMGLVLSLLPATGMVTMSRS